MSRIQWKSLMLVPMLTLGACGGDDDGDDKGPVEELVDAGFNLAKEKDLPGTEWTAGCQSIDLFGDALDVSAEEQWKFAGTSTDVTRSFKLYGNEDCSELAGQMEIIGNYTLQDEDNQDQNPVDFKFDKVTVTPQSENMASALSTVSWCGIENWQVDQQQDITDTVGRGLCQVPQTIGQTTYGLLKVEDDQLFMGTPLTSAPTEKSQRPQEVDRSVEFEKK